MKSKTVFLAVALCSLAIIGVCIPAAGGEAEHTLVATAGFNVTNASLANVTFPAQYQVTPTRIQIGISTNDTSLDGPKGEMAVVPRTIGFSAGPEFVMIVIIMIIAIGVSAGYILKRKQDDKKQE
jgi:hypothetical protein